MFQTYLLRAGKSIHILDTIKMVNQDSLLDRVHVWAYSVSSGISDSKFRRVKMRFYVILPVMLILVPNLLFAATIGSVSKASGEVLFRAGDNIKYVSLKKGQSLDEGNWVKTGTKGWLELLLADGSKFTIANNSELELTSFMVGKEKKEGSFTLTQGKLRASVVKLGGQQTDIKVRSRTAVAGIRGTEFLMMAQGPANVFFGNEGIVKVSGSGEDVTPPLLPGTMTQNTRGCTPLEPIKVETGTPLAQAKNAFEGATSAVPPAEWLASDNLSSIIARWNINYGHYLADSGKHEAALQVFQIALDLTKDPEIRSDAHLERGSVYSRLLSNSEAALAEYLLVLEEYPTLKQAETALAFTGQTLYDLGFKEEAKARFKEYLKKYPEGKQKGNVETMLNLLKTDK
jgi:FecR-like protein